MTTTATLRAMQTQPGPQVKLGESAERIMREGRISTASATGEFFVKAPVEDQPIKIGRKKPPVVEYLVSLEHGKCSCGKATRCVHREAVELHVRKAIFGGSYRSQGHHGRRDYAA